MSFWKQETRFSFCFGLEKVFSVYFVMCIFILLFGNCWLVHLNEFAFICKLTMNLVYPGDFSIRPSSVKSLYKKLHKNANGLRKRVNNCLMCVSHS